MQFLYVLNNKWLGKTHSQCDKHNLFHNAIFFQLYIDICYMTMKQKEQMDTQNCTNLGWNMDNSSISWQPPTILFNAARSDTCKHCNCNSANLTSVTICSYCLYDYYCYDFRFSFSQPSFMVIVIWDTSICGRCWNGFIGWDTRTKSIQTLMACNITLSLLIYTIHHLSMT